MNAKPGSRPLNYREQQEYLRRSRLWAIPAVAVVLGVSWACLHAAVALSRSTAVVFLLVVIALTVSLLYTPDYLQLTANPEKRWRWQIKIRWRIIAAVLVLSIVLAPDNGARMTGAVSAVSLALANFIGAKVVRGRYFALYFWLTDFFIALWSMGTELSFLLGTALL